MLTVNEYLQAAVGTAAMPSPSWWLLLLLLLLQAAAAVAALQRHQVQQVQSRHSHGCDTAGRFRECKAETAQKQAAPVHSFRAAAV